MEPARALALIEPRLKRFGYTPFLGRQGDLVWIRAVPLADVKEPSRPGLNLLLFVLTVLSTLAAGCLISGSFPFVTFNPVPAEPLRLLDGVPFSFTLLAILGTHEFGHYFTARYYGASVSLPFFIPAPPPLFLFGTMGAVIRMRSPARDRNSLFDIAVAGPLAGLVVAIPALLLGLQWSRVGMVLPEQRRHDLRGLAAHAAAHLDGVRAASRQGWTSSCIRSRSRAGWASSSPRSTCSRSGSSTAAASRTRSCGARHRQVSIATLVGLVALGAVFQSAELDRLRRARPAAHGLPPRPAARRPHPAVAPALRPRRLLPDPADRPDPARPHQLARGQVLHCDISDAGVLCLAYRNVVMQDLTPIR